MNLNGASIKQDKDETAVLYGKIIPFQTILSGKVEPPSREQNLPCYSSQVLEHSCRKERRGIDIAAKIRHGFD